MSDAKLTSLAIAKLLGIPAGNVLLVTLQQCRSNLHRRWGPSLDKLQDVLSPNAKIWKIHRHYYIEDSVLFHGLVDIYHLDYNNPEGIHLVAGNGFLTKETLPSASLLIPIEIR